jgi:hypothetical protein
VRIIRKQRKDKNKRRKQRETKVWEKKKPKKREHENNETKPRDGEHKNFKQDKDDVELSSILIHFTSIREKVIELHSARTMRKKR